MAKHAHGSNALDWAYYWEHNAPDKPYLTQPLGNGGVKEYTWKQALDEARRMAAHLRGLNLPAKSQVALVSKNMAHWIIADLAIWMSGHVTVPVYPTLSAEGAQQILEHSEAKLLFVGKLDDWDGMKGGVPEGLPMIALPLSPPVNAPKWDEIIREHEPISDSPVPKGEELATIIYTSGSTGVPKGVMHTFDTMAAISHASEDLMAKPEDRMLSYLPLAHSYERTWVEVASMYSGMHLYFAESLDTFVQDLQRARPTIFVSVPRLWVRFQLGVWSKVPEEKLNKLLKIPVVSWLVKRKVLKGLGLDKVRLAASGSAPLPPDVLVWYRRLGLNLLEGYGMTENSSYSHASRSGRSRIGYVGDSQPSVETRISDNGEILVKSPGTMIGYFKAPDLTREVLTEDGWLHTGDMGEVDDHGRLRITGRLKELFKTSKGKYIAPSPIENKLTNHPMIEQVCVSGENQSQPYALVLLSDEARAKAQSEAGRKAIEAALQAHLEAVNQTLEHHERLDFLAVVKDNWLTENGFLTPTMKVRRSIIENAYAGLTAGWYAEQKPVVWQSAA